MNEWIHACIDGQIDRQTDRWMDRERERDMHTDRRKDIFTSATCSGTPLTGFPPSILKLSTAASTSTHSSPMNAAALSCSNPDTFTCIRRVRVSVFVCVCVCVRVRVRVCNIYTYVETYIHAHIRTYIHACTNTSVHPYTYIRTNTNTHTRVHTFIRTGIQTCTHTRICQVDVHAARVSHWSLVTGNYTCTRRGSIGTSGVLLRPASSSPIT